MIICSCMYISVVLAPGFIKIATELPAVQLTMCYCRLIRRLIDDGPHADDD